MTDWRTFLESQTQRRTASLTDDYRVLGDGPAVVDRSYRALLEVRGEDRASWLHNLTTNQVKPLGQNEGNYAFALNVHGRILFDLNVIVRADCIWIDLKEQFLDVAKKHFEKYTIMEDVVVADRTADFVRLGIVGEQAKPIATDLRVSNAPAMPTLGLAEGEWGGDPVQVLRHDFCGPFAVELFLADASAIAFLKHVTSESLTAPARLVSDEAVQVRRIEAGIPWPGFEITDEYLPAETGQLARAVSFQKGCYLGQEVVERMRARGVVARRLRGLRIEGDAVPPRGTMLSDSVGATIGTVTSSCHSIALDEPIALVYVKTASASAGQVVHFQQGDRMARATVAELPFVGHLAD